jgi:hypothetical protein
MGVRERKKRSAVYSRPFDYAQGKQSKAERGKIRRAKRRDTECTEVRGRRNGDGFCGEVRACLSRLASGLSVNRVKSKPFEDPFVS